MSKYVNMTLNQNYSPESEDPVSGLVPVETNADVERIEAAEEAELIRKDQEEVENITEEVISGVGALSRLTKRVNTLTKSVDLINSDNMDEQDSGILPAEVVSKSIEEESGVQVPIIELKEDGSYSTESVMDWLKEVNSNLVRSVRAFLADLRTSFGRLLDTKRELGRRLNRARSMRNKRRFIGRNLKLPRDVTSRLLTGFELSNEIGTDAKRIVDISTEAFEIIKKRNNDYLDSISRDISDIVIGRPSKPRQIDELEADLADFVKRNKDVTDLMGNLQFELVKSDSRLRFSNLKLTNNDKSYLERSGLQQSGVEPLTEGEVDELLDSLETLIYGDFAKLLEGIEKSVEELDDSANAITSLVEKYTTSENTTLKDDIAAARFDELTDTLYSATSSITSIYNASYGAIDAALVYVEQTVYRD